MRPTIALTLIAIVSLAPMTPSGVAQDPTGVLYELIVDCPQRRLLVDINDVICPVQAIDGQDAMGSPSVGVDPRNPNNLVMASLHGSPAGNGPTDLSRGGMPFTTFTSIDHGGSWVDNPYSPPTEMNGAFGEHPQITIDPYGRVYVGSMYARREAADQYQWVIAAQKFKSLQEADARQNGAFNVQYLDSIMPNNQITQYWFLFNPDTENMTILWHEKPYKRVSTNPPLAADGLLPGRQRAQQQDILPLGGLIASASTTPATRSPYIYAPDEYFIGPCSASTNPVLSEGFVYVGCVADPLSGPFKWNPNTKAGTVEMFRFDPDDQKPQYLGSSPITGGKPKIGARSDGRIALFATDVNQEGRTLLVGTYGHYKGGRIEWSTVYEYASKFRNLNIDRRVVEVNIQDLEYREHTGAVHLILKERTQAAAAVSVDTPTNMVQPSITKTLIAVDERYGFLDLYNFDIGNRVNRTDPALLAHPDSTYNDLSDDLVQLPPRPFKYGDKDMGDSYQREFFAVGDFGIVQFAEIIEITNIRAPGVPPPAPPPPPIAAAAASFSATTVMIWAGGLSLSSLFAAAMLANRRKNPLAAYTKGEK